MALFALEQSKLAYRADFALYALAVPAVAIGLLAFGPHARWPGMLGWSVAGLFGWTLVEYLLHRFLLHGLQPFRGWHEAHHTRPTARICTPTVLSAGLIVALVFAPAWLLSGLWQAGALTLGVLIGYLAYAVIHHGTHHWRADNAWLKRRKRSHAAHHHSRRGVSFGVTSGVWDQVFGSAPRAQKRRG
jgi:sterol desaturase/sphingolipid hydroxylase (fatty acid hydroxylase superfamily)